MSHADVAGFAKYHDYSDSVDWGGRVCSFTRRAFAGFGGEWIQGPARLLPRGGDFAAHERQRHQDRSVDAGVGLERKISGSRQWRLGGRDQLRGDEPGTEERL